MKRVVPTPFPADPLVSDAAVLGAAIRSARTGAGMTIDQAAASIGISKQTLSDLETSGATVGLGIALRVARELGVALFVARPGEREVIRRAIPSQPSAVLAPSPLVGTLSRKAVEAQQHQVARGTGDDDDQRPRKRSARK